jgi:hypothetical protein
MSVANLLLDFVARPGRRTESLEGLGALLSAGQMDPPRISDLKPDWARSSRSRPDVLDSR